MLGALLAAREHAGEVRLLNVTRRLTSIGIVVALHRYFSVFDSEEEALESVGASLAGMSADVQHELWARAVHAA